MTISYQFLEGASWAPSVSAIFDKSKMADGRHLEKSKNGQISASVRSICTKFGMVTHIGTARHTGS